MEGASLRTAQRPQSLATVAYDSIREAITSKALPPGRRLTEADLAQQLSVSKTPVREALLRLRQVGLIEPDGQRGARVVTPSTERMRHAFEVREALETFTARIAAERGTASDREAVDHAARASATAADNGQYAEFHHWDFAFHAAIASAVENPRIETILDDVHALVAALLERDSPELRAGIDAQAHLDIARAIAAGDPDASARAMREHLRYVKELALAGAPATAEASPPPTARTRSRM